MGGPAGSSCLGNGLYTYWPAPDSSTTWRPGPTAYCCPGCRKSDVAKLGGGPSCGIWKMGSGFRFGLPNAGSGVGRIGVPPVAGAGLPERSTLISFFIFSGCLGAIR